MTYSSKSHVLMLAALLKAFNIQHIVLSPGSRNAPLIQTFSQHPDFICYNQVDERNAGFFALGLIQQYQKPVVICCTSGTALLNYGPAIAEAYYQRLPLIVISADRPHAWLGQMDGQTVPQAQQFATITQCSVHIDDDDRPESVWHTNRLLNEALIAVTEKDARPVHINMALSEPLFDFSTATLPTVRKIAYHKTLSHSLLQHFQQAKKKMIVVGQLPPHSPLTATLIQLANTQDCAVFVEPISNQSDPAFITRFDAFLATQTDESFHSLQPDLVITLGGHIVSKRLKHMLRRCQPATHWHLSEVGEIIDLFQSLTDVIALSEQQTLTALCQLAPMPAAYSTHWQQLTRAVPLPNIEQQLTDISAMGQFLRYLPTNALLHVANSSVIRHLDLFPRPDAAAIYCNRGTNGIDGTLSTLLGFAQGTDKPVYLLIGDLSFFYNLNALWQIDSIPNLRIVLMNNGGGGIFHLLPHLNQSSALQTYVSASHQTEAQKWATAAGLAYQRATDLATLKQAFTQLTDPTQQQSMMIEVITEMTQNQAAYQAYYQHIQTQFNLSYQTERA